MGRVIYCPDVLPTPEQRLGLREEGFL